MSSLLERWPVERIERVYLDPTWSRGMRRLVAGNIAKHWPVIAAALEERDLGDDPMVAAALGTIAAEAARFEPVPEDVHQYNTAPGGRPFGLYDFRTDIGNNAEGDGELRKGRGFPQLTGGYNYESFGEELGIDLIGNPDLALDPRISARILAAFLARCAVAMRKAMTQRKWKAARRLVNGGSHGLVAFTRVAQAALAA